LYLIQAINQSKKKKRKKEMTQKMNEESQPNKKIKKDKVTE
jgi:hypothetical protein